MSLIARKKVFAVRHKDKALEGRVGKHQVASEGEVFVRELAIDLSMCQKGNGSV